MDEKETGLLTDEELNGVIGGAAGPGNPPKFNVYDQVRIKANGNMGFVIEIYPEGRTYSYELSDDLGRWEEKYLVRA